MAKKKNREKELRRQQKLERREARQAADPVFVELAHPQHVDELYDAILAYAKQKGKSPENLSQQELTNINQLLALDQFPFPKATRLFHQAMHTPDNHKRAKLLKEVLTLEPDHFSAKYHLLRTRQQLGSPEYLDAVLQFYEEVKQGWEAVNFLDWDYFPARPYLRALSYIIEYLYQETFLALAAEVASFVLVKKVKRPAPDFLPLTLAIYNELGRFHLVEAIYYSYLPLLPKQKDSLIFHMIVAKLLQGQVKEASSLFTELLAVNKQALDFFSDNWLEQLAVAHDLDVYRPFTRQSIALAAYHLAHFFHHNVTLCNLLGNLALEHGGLPRDSSFLDFYSGFRQSLFDGIRLDIYQILHQQNLRTLEDFKQVTEKDLLAIKGIGQGTIKKLKDNGVRFKSS